MLTQKSQEVPFVSVFKLSTGEEIIAKVTDDGMLEYTIKTPLQMVMGQQGPQFAPWMMMADPDKTIPLKKQNIVGMAPPNANLESQYDSITSGIALPKKSAIIK